MRLAELEIFTVAPPDPGMGGRYWIFPRLTTTCGIVGYGECYASTVGPAAMRAVIEDVFARYFEGENPENVERMFRRTYSSGFTQRPDPTVMGAFSGLEIACWDILGKARDRPVWALMGGRMNERVRAYTYLYPLAHHDSADFWISPEMAAEAAASVAEKLWKRKLVAPPGPASSLGGAGDDVQRKQELLGVAHIRHNQHHKVPGSQEMRDSQACTELRRLSCTSSSASA